PEELKYIAKKMRLYFECKNKNRLHVYTNGAFDMCMARRDFGVRFFKTNVWDILAGQFGLDENHKAIQTVTGFYYYSLLNLSMQYGCKAYYESTFGKEQRAFIADANLEGGVLDYMALDVIIPMHIYRLQCKQAKRIGYDKYESLVGQQLSDTIHTLSNLEYNGSYIDIDWLFHLKSRNSPIVQERKRVLAELYATDGVKKANKILQRKSGAPAVGLFGRADTQGFFNIRKEDHKQLLFFEVLKLEPLQTNKKGLGKIDKDFQKKYEDVPEVKLFNELNKINKLFDSYVKSFVHKWGDDQDFRFDRNLRPSFGYLDVVTGRTSARNPTLQTLPQRTALGKLIKRMFVAQEGRLFLKVDYSVHEVRGWSLISGDKEVADVFRVGMDLRNKFKERPSVKLAQEIELKGDPHKINAAYFFRLPLEKVEKPKRNSVKQVVFGLIYQQSEKGTAKAINATLDEVKELVGKFFKRFPVGAGWFDRIKEFARKNLFVESPLGRRRNLWGLLMPKSHPDHDPIVARNERQSVNSPVQGMGSDFMMTGAREIEKQRYAHYKETGHYPDFIQTNSVHDSLEFS